MMTQVIYQKKAMLLLGWRIDWPDTSKGVIGNIRWCGIDDWATKDRMLAIGAVAVKIWSDPVAELPELREKQEVLEVFVQADTSDMSPREVDKMVRKDIPMVASTHSSLQDHSSMLSRLAKTDFSRRTNVKGIEEKDMTAEQLKLYWSTNIHNVKKPEGEWETPHFPRINWLGEAINRKTTLQYWDWALLNIKEKA